MLTRAPGPACGNGWVCFDPHEGHGGRGGVGWSVTAPVPSPGAFARSSSSIPRFPFLSGQRRSSHVGVGLGCAGEEQFVQVRSVLGGHRPNSSAVAWRVSTSASRTWRSSRARTPPAGAHGRLEEPEARGSRGKRAERTPGPRAGAVPSPPRRSHGSLVLPPGGRKATSRMRFAFTAPIVSSRVGAEPIGPFTGPRLAVVSGASEPPAPRGTPRAVSPARSRGTCGSAQTRSRMRRGLRANPSGGRSSPRSP